MRTAPCSVAYPSPGIHEICDPILIAQAENISGYPFQVQLESEVQCPPTSPQAWRQEVCDTLWSTPGPVCRKRQPGTCTVQTTGDEIWLDEVDERSSAILVLDDILLFRWLPMVSILL